MTSESRLFDNSNTSAPPGLHDFGSCACRTQVFEGNEIDDREFFDGAQGIAFDFARGAEARAYLVQVGVIVAGVRHEFPYALRELLQESADRVCVDDPGSGDGDGSIRGAEALLGEDTAEVRSESAQCEDFGAADKRGAGRCTDGPFRFEWVAYSVDVGRRGSAQHGPQNLGKHVCVLMSVDVRQV